MKSLSMAILVWIVLFLIVVAPREQKESNPFDGLYSLFLYWYHEAWHRVQYLAHNNSNKHLLNGHWNKWLGSQAIEVHLLEPTRELGSEDIGSDSTCLARFPFRCHSNLSKLTLIASVDTTSVVSSEVKKKKQKLRWITHNKFIPVFLFQRKRGSWKDKMLLLLL